MFNWDRVFCKEFFSFLVLCRSLWSFFLDNGIIELLLEIGEDLVCIDEGEFFFIGGKLLYLGFFLKIVGFFEYLFWVCLCFWNFFILLFFFINSFLSLRFFVSRLIIFWERLEKFCWVILCFLCKCFLSILYSDVVSVFFLRRRWRYCIRFSIKELIRFVKYLM